MKITALTANGRKAVSKRTYKTCAKSRQKKKKKKRKR